MRSRGNVHEDVSSTQAPYQVQLACACCYGRPVVESHIVSVLTCGAGQMRYKGPQGAVVQLDMTVMAHNGVALVRIHQQRLSKRGQKFRALWDALAARTLP